MGLKIYLIETLKYLLRSDPIIHRKIKEVERLYNMSDQERRDYENESFLRIFRAVIRKSKFYKELYAQAGILETDIESINDIKKLPVITKSQIKQCSKDLLTVPRYKVRIAHTSGTTGEPLIVYNSWNSIWSARAYHYLYYKNCGYKYGKDKAVSLRGHLGRHETKMNIHLAKTLFLSSYNIRQETIRDYYKSIKEYNPKAIFGYPSSLYNLAFLLKDNGLSLDIPLGFTSSETLYEYQRGLISEIFNCEIYDLYGNTENAVLLYESNDHSGYYLAPGYCHLEIKKDCMLATSFTDMAWPLIRYCVTDIVEPSDSIERCQSQPILVKYIQGRTESKIICKDGTIIGRLDLLFKTAKGIRMAQIIQREHGKIEVNIVPDKGFDQMDIVTIEQSIDKRIGRDNIDYTINSISPEDIIYSTRNKFNQIVSYL